MLLKTCKKLKVLLNKFDFYSSDYTKPLQSIRNVLCDR